MENLIGQIIFGLIVGVIAKFLMPGRDPGGFIITALIGMVGSVIGTFVSTSPASLYPTVKSPSLL